MSKRLDPNRRSQLPGSKEAEVDGRTLEVEEPADWLRASSGSSGSGSGSTYVVVAVVAVAVAVVVVVVLVPVA